MERKNKDLVDIENYWIEWVITKSTEDNFLVTSNFRVINYPKRRKCFVPLLWIRDLIIQQNTDLLHLLRTPNHRPQNAYKLVKFIKDLEIILN